MGYTTYFNGEIQIEPPLNDEEISYLNKFSASRRMKRDQGPYYTGDDKSGVENYNKPPECQPGLWCQWVPCRDGEVLVWDEGEKFYNAAEWMAYIIQHFLEPDAVAKQANPAAFAEFVPHVLNGKIEAVGEDPDDRWQLEVIDNAVYFRLALPVEYEAVGREVTLVKFC